MSFRLPWRFLPKQVLGTPPVRKLQDLPPIGHHKFYAICKPKRLNPFGSIATQGISVTESRRRRKSLKKLIDEAAEAAEGRSTTVGQPLLEELEDLVWHEDEIVVFSQDLVDLPGRVYRDIGSGLKRRGFKVKRQREVELRKDRLMYVTRYLVEGDGVGEEAIIYAKLHHLAVVETA